MAALARGVRCSNLRDRQAASQRQIPIVGVEDTLEERKPDVTVTLVRRTPQSHSRGGGGRSHTREEEVAIMFGRCFSCSAFTLWARTTPASVTGSTGEGRGTHISNLALAADFSE